MSLARRLERVSRCLPKPVDLERERGRRIIRFIMTDLEAVELAMVLYGRLAGDDDPPWRDKQSTALSTHEVSAQLAARLQEMGWNLDLPEPPCEVPQARSS